MKLSGWLLSTQWSTLPSFWPTSTSSDKQRRRFFSKQQISFTLSSNQVHSKVSLFVILTHPAGRLLLGMEPSNALSSFDRFVDLHSFFIDTSGLIFTWWSMCPQESSHFSSLARLPPLSMRRKALWINISTGSNFNPHLIILKVMKNWFHTWLPPFPKWCSFPKVFLLSGFQCTWRKPQWWWTPALSFSSSSPSSKERWDQREENRFYPINGSPEMTLFPRYIVHLSLPWSIGWVALSFLVWLFGCPAMVTPFKISLLVAPHPKTHTFSESLW